LLLPQSSQLLGDVATRPSIVTFSLGEITIKPATLIKYLELMPHLKVLKIGALSFVPTDRKERTERDLCKDQPKSPPLALSDLEQFEYQGISDYLEVVASRISAPFLKTLSITFANKVGDDLDSTFKYTPRLINEAAGLAFQFARLRFKDGFSFVMDHDELWTGRGAFELKFNHRKYYFNPNMGLVAKICRALVPMPSLVQSLLVEDANRNGWWDRRADREGWVGLLGIFDNVKTLRLAGRFVQEFDKILQPPAPAGENSKEGSASEVVSLLPKLQNIVQYGPVREFAALVEAGQEAGRPVRVVRGPRNRLTLY